MEIEESEPTSIKTPTWEEIVAANLQQRELHKIHPLFNARSIVGKKFPIPAQFIFELLQNADDALAKNVRLTFANDEFTCEHDGLKQFQESDAIGICSIGYTGKDETENSIGRFGLGFKSVFQYTDSVRIYTDKYNFALFDYLWIKNGIARPHTLSKTEGNTAFIFKVSDVIIDLVKAREEIIRGLVDLNHRSLIFLHNISCLEININGKTSRITKLSKGADVYEVTIEEEASIKKSLWLRKLKAISLPVYLNSPLVIKKGTFGLTIQLDGDEFTASRISPIPSDKGVVFSYFPLNLENSGLQFFIHAPFFVEDNRLQFSLNPDSKPGNDDLLAELGRLASEVIVEQINLGSDADSLISLLPLSSEISEKYRPFLNSLLDGFRTARIIKPLDGELETAGKFFNLSHDMQGIFNKNDLSILARCVDTFENSLIRDANEVPISFQPEYLSQRSLRVLHQVGMVEISDKIGRRIIELFAAVFDPGIFDSRIARPTREIINIWLGSRTSQELANLYSFISKEFNSNEILKDLPIFRVGEPRRHSFLRFDQIYLARNHGDTGDDILDSSIFNLADVAENKEMIRRGNCLRRFGISTKDKWEVLKRDYRDSQKRIFDEELEKKEFTRLLDFYREDKSRLLQIVKQSFSLFCVNREGGLELKKPTISIMRNARNANLLIQLFSETSSEDYFLPVWNGYYLNEEADALLEDLGVRTELFVYEYENKKYGISFLSRIIESKNQSHAKQLWGHILTLNQREYFNSAVLWKTGGAIVETELCKTLREKDWIPCQDGSFRKPYDCDISTILSELEFTECLALEKLNFGGATRDNLRNSDIEQAKAKDLGFDSIEQVEELKRYLNLVGLDFVKQALADHERKQFESIRGNIQNFEDSAQEFDGKRGINSERENKSRNASFQPAEPRYADELSSDFDDDSYDKLGKRNAEISKTSEIYADSVITDLGKAQSARLKEIEAKSRVIIQKANEVLGRNLISMHAQNEGYDFEFHENGRKKYIEAKGTVNKWDAAGIRLSPREIDYANKYGADYEIWIVEELETNSPKIWRISDFPSRVGGFRLNESWKPQAMLFGDDFGEAKGD
jgi:hypothetical protein